nr:MAG TPA: hypothetical protein [Inoviridae sp.]
MMWFFGRRACLLGEDVFAFTCLTLMGRLR